MNIDLGKAIFDALFNDENREKMIDELNKVVNIPIIGEEMERKIISNLFESPSVKKSVLPVASLKLVLAIVTIFFFVRAMLNNSKLALDPVLVTMFATVGISVILNDKPLAAVLLMDVPTIPPVLLVVRLADALEPNVELNVIVSAFEYPVPVLLVSVTESIVVLSEYTSKVWPALNDVCSTPALLPELT